MSRKHHNATSSKGKDSTDSPCPSSPPISPYVGTMSPIVPPPGSAMCTASISATESVEILDLPSSRPSNSDLPSVSTQFERIERIDMDNIKNCHIKLNRKITFCDACKGLADSVDDIFASTSIEDGRQKALINATCRAFTVLQSRFSDPRFWESGLNLFLSLEFQLENLTRKPDETEIDFASAAGSSAFQPTAVKSGAASRTSGDEQYAYPMRQATKRSQLFHEALEDCRKWKRMALEMVDEEHRAQSVALQKQLRLMEERRQNQNRWNDASGMFSAEDLTRMLGFQVVGEDAPRPAASRNARDNLRLVTITKEHKNTTCVVCLEEIPLGGKAKIMPCGHYFHEHCLLQWLETNHVCPLCRAELPTEKQSFDLDAERIAARGPPPGTLS